ncbi:MAG: hypothetical protein PHS41_07010, partial [Victivallaceae bacterium]|nr:hypothetical protein [Victivallaceae bacterium]
STAGSLVVVNDPKSAAEEFESAAYRFRFTPEFQLLVKDDTQSTTVESFDTSEYSYFLSAPIVCFGKNADKGALTLMGQWVLTVDSLSEVDGRGLTSVDSNTFSSNITLECGTEKLVAEFSKNVKVNQYNGMPFLGEIPVLKYLFGAESKVDSKMRVFVTMEATPIIGKNLPKGKLNGNTI